ncbi:MAG TPA: SBBP repeat-containing protein, partial [bacterium]|nr:SBBP repeat-containing protein [bacterium]
MSRLFVALVLIFIIAGCDSNNNKTDEDQVIDTEVDDQDTSDEELSFELTPKTIETGEKTSRDIISCGEMIVICGESSGTGYVAAYKNGFELWKNATDDYHIQSFNTLACGNDDTIYAAGDRYAQAESPLSGFLQALNMDGTIKWEKVLDNQKAVSIYAVTTDNEGNVYAGGRVDGSFENTTGIGEKDGFVAKYLASGEPVFISQFGTEVFDTVQAVAIGSDGFILAAGHSAGDLETGLGENDSETGMKGFVVKLKPDGTIHWKKMYESDSFWDISTFLPGSFFIAGNITKSGLSKAVIFQAGLDGRIKATYNLTAEKNITATGISHDGKNNIYLTGYIDGNFSSGSRIPPVTTELKQGNNVFLGIISTFNGKLLYSGIFGGDSHDINPKVAVDSFQTPHLLYYSVENLTDSSGTAAMIRLERE